MRLNKNTKIFLNYFLGPLLFTWLSWSIYNEVKQQPDLARSWSNIVSSLASYKVIYLVAAVLLMIVNWSIETLKWKISVQGLQSISFVNAFKAVLSGVSFSVTTPNRIGEYLGRILYMEESKRLKAISLTIVGSISQLIVTLLAGCIGFLLIKPELLTSGVGKDLSSTLWLDVLQWGVLIVLGILTVFYFRLHMFGGLIDRFRGGRYRYLLEALQGLNATILFKILSLSTIRYIVFLIQYVLLFRLFNVNIDLVQSFAAVSVIFLVLAVIPSFAIADYLVRGEVSLRILGLFSLNSLGISMTAATIWLINLVIPAIVGSLLILSIKIYRNKNEGN